MIFVNFESCVRFEIHRCPPFSKLLKLKNVLSEKKFAPKIRSIAFLEDKIGWFQLESEVAKISDFLELRDADLATCFVTLS